MANPSLTRTLVAGLVALLIALACARGTPPTPTTPTTHTSAPTSTPEPTVTPLPTPTGRSGLLNLAVPVAAPHWDIHLTPSPILAAWGPGIVYSRLLRFRSGQQVTTPTMVTECDLCESWRQVDSTTYLFHLRQDVFWQDIPPVSGRALVAGDIVFSYQRQMSPGSPNAPLLRSIQSVEAPDEHTVEITLHAPDADFLASLASGFSKIVAPEAVQLNGNLEEGPVIGTGPWLWEGDRNGLAYFFRANPDYYEDGLPYLERLVIHFIPDESTRVAAFSVKTLDLVDVPPEELDGLRQSHSEIGTLVYREPGTGLEISLNSAMPPLDNPQVRKAFFKALDPWDDIEDIWNGYGFVSLGMPVERPDWLLPQQEMREYLLDPSGAIELLQLAPGEHPIPLALTVAYYTDAHMEYGQRIAEELESVGFGVTLEAISPTRYPQEVWFGGRYQAFVGPIAPMTTPNMYLLSVLHSQGELNTHGYRDPGLDSLIEEQSAMMDPVRRRDVVLDIQRYIMDRAVRFMPVTRVSTWVWWPRVKSFFPNLASSEYFHLARIWVEP
ncbi:MAG: ABC transporter substrate-binding protein [Chloroflexi bacterium]|nr:ABC transporter substrate-binding protein [Chloroflexota bacterium]